MNHPTGQQVRGSYFYFDLIRFIAASLVVVDHLRDMIWLQWPELQHPSLLLRPVYFLTGFGAAAVTVFFVLSGYWISQSVFRRMNDPGFWRIYLIDRLSRLWVVIIPALLLGLACDLAGRYWIGSALHLGTSGALTEQVDVSTRISSATFLGNLTFLQTVFVPVFGSNGSLWSLSNEFWYYIWFPAIAISITRRSPSLFLITLLVAVAGPHLISGFVIWTLGGMLAWVDTRWAKGSPRGPGWAMWGSLVLFAGVTSAVRLGVAAGGLGGIVEGLAFALFAWTMLRRDPAPLAPLAPLARLGADSSFSLYAIHMPVIALGVAIVSPQGRIAPTLVGSLMLLLAYVVMVAIAQGFASLTERQTGYWRNLLRARLPSAAPRTA